MTEEVSFGCLFCKTGGETHIVSRLAEEMPEIKAIAPVKKRIRRTPGGKIEEEVILFPGYVFFEADAAFEAYRLARETDVYRLLKTDDDEWRLQGGDRDLVSRLFAGGGVVDLSKARYEGDRIRILDGFLKDYEGQIIRVNRRNSTAQVRIQFGGRTAEVWMGFEVIEDAASSGNEKPLDMLRTAEAESGNSENDASR